MIGKAYLDFGRGSLCYPPHDGNGIWQCPVSDGICARVCELEIRIVDIVVEEQLLQGCENDAGAAPGRLTETVVPVVIGITSVAEY